MLAHRLLQSAIRDAATGDRVEAAHALRWLRARTDWTRLPLAVRMERWGAPVPSPEARAQFVLSADWCLQVLGWPRSVLTNGLPVARASTRDVFGWGKYGGLRCWRLWRSQRKVAQRARAIGRAASFERQRAKLTGRRATRIIEGSQPRPQQRMASRA